METNNNFIEDIIKEMFRGTNEALLSEGDTAAVTMSKQDLSNKFEKYLDNQENQKRTQSLAKNYGVNLDRGAERKAYKDSMLGVTNSDDPNTVVPKGSYEKAVGTIGNELKNALKDYNVWINPNTPKEVRAELGKKWGGFAGFQRYKDIADKMSLTPAYDQQRAKEAGINVAPFGTNYKTVAPNGEMTLTPKKPTSTPEKVNKAGEVVRPFKPADAVTGYDFENLDLTNVPDKDIIKYFKTGTRKDHPYDEKTGERTNPNKNKTYAELADMADKGDKRAMSDLKNLYFKAMFNKLLNSKFGYDFKMPTSMYTYGNAKLPNDTLVINFTTAHRCPAWNECLVGYACYARGSEHNYEGLHKKNSNLHLMWSSAKHDSNLLNAMFNVIKMHLINPGNIANSLLSDPNTQGKWIEILGDKDANFTPLNKKTLMGMTPKTQNTLAMPGKNDVEDDEMPTEGKTLLGQALQEVMGEAGRNTGLPKAPKRPKGARDNLAGLIFTHKFQDLFDEKDIEVIKNTPNSFRAKFIRLNEEGDFIGQWLLDAFDEFAGELKVLGISTAAYTCRNLNFTKIQNIIINASTMNVGTGGEEDGNVSNAIARRFFAVSSELYNRLDDTYVPTGRKINYIVPDGKIPKGEYDGKKPLVPLHETGDGLHVKYDLKAFTNGEDTTNPVTYNDRFDPNGDTVKRRLYYKCPCGRHGDVLGDNGKPLKMDCYLCRMCYEPKDQKVGEIYVLVEVHGDNIDSFDMNKANQQRGISNNMATYREAKAIFANRLCEEHKQAEEKGLELVGQNIIDSVKKRLTEIGNKAVGEIPMESKKFNDMIKLIEKADKNRGNKIID